MTQTPEPIDLDAVMERYRATAALIDWGCVEDVPALIAEIRRLQQMLHPVYGEETVTGPDGTPEGLITITGHQGAEEWNLSCSEHGMLGSWSVVPYADKTEAELAWEQHVTWQHMSGRYVRDVSIIGGMQVTYESWGPATTGDES